MENIINNKNKINNKNIIDNKNCFSDIKIINEEIIELTSLIDKKTLKILEENENSNKKILQYKLLLENMILEYHKICKELYDNK